MSSTSMTSACRPKAFTRARSSGVARSAMCDVTPPFLTAMPQQSYICEVSQVAVSEPAFAMRHAPELVAEVADAPSLSNFFNLFRNKASQAVDTVQAEASKAVPSGSKAPDVIDTDIKVPRMPDFKTPSNDKQADDLLKSDVAFRMAPAPVAELAQAGPPKPDVSANSEGKPVDADIPDMPDFGVPADDKQADELLQTEPVSFRFAASPVAELAEEPVANSKPADTDIPSMPDFGVPKDDKQAEQLLQVTPVAEVADLPPPFSFFESMRKAGADEGESFKAPDPNTTFKPANTDSTPALDTNTKVPGMPSFGTPSNDKQADQLLK